MILSKMRTHVSHNVVAYLALFFAIGGGSFALAALDRHDKKVVKKIAGKQITKRAPGLSVKHADTADTADSAAPSGPAAGDLAGSYPGPVIGSGAVGTAKLADGAVDATKLADPPRFGFIRDNGNGDVANVVYGRGVTAVADDANAGNYTVTFNGSLENCVVQLQQGLGFPSGNTSSATIGPAHPDVFIDTSNPEDAVVTFYNGSNVIEDTSFMITATC